MSEPDWQAAGQDVLVRPFNDGVQAMPADGKRQLEVWARTERDAIQRLVVQLATPIGSVPRRGAPGSGPRE